jgi:uncharacterized protein (DUF2141 family)
MKLSFIKSILLILALSCPLNLYCQEEKSGKIFIEITHIRNEKGNVKISLFDKAEPFPNDREQAVARIIAEIDGTQASAVFEDMPFGEYGIALIHDENNNLFLDSNLFGMPKEGYGASNNPPRRMGPPLYKDAKFNFESPELRLTIKMIYF